MKRLIKFGLVSLLSFLGLSCFCSAGTYIYSGTANVNSDVNPYVFAFPIPVSTFPTTSITVSCTISNYSGNDYSTLRLDFNGARMNDTQSSTMSVRTLKSSYNIAGNHNVRTYTQDNGALFGITCGKSAGDLVFSFDWSCTITTDNLISCPACQECESCPEVDTNYCVENDLCPVPSNFSQLYINDIEHESAPLINVYVPDEIGWDYTSDSGQFDLYVSGYNVDTEYIESLINAQNYKPSSEDFNNVITGLIPLIIPGLVIILFIRFIFRFIKKIF